MYTELTLIIEGALDESAIFFPNDSAEMDQWLESVQSDAQLSGLETQVFKIEHAHDVRPGVLAEDCVCVQFLTDHHPLFHWNKKRT